MYEYNISFPLCPHSPKTTEARPYIDGRLIDGRLSFFMHVLGVSITCSTAAELAAATWTVDRIILCVSLGGMLDTAERAVPSGTAQRSPGFHPVSQSSRRGFIISL